MSAGRARIVSRLAGELLALTVVIVGCKEDVSADGAGGRLEERETTKSAGSRLDIQGKLEIVDGQRKESIPLDALARRIPTEVIESSDPYYEMKKRYGAFPLSEVILATFGSSEDLSTAEFSFVAKDGYEVRVPGELVFHSAAYLAHRDEDHDDWQPIGDQGADPGPLYMVWKGEEFSDEKTYPRPWGLTTIKRLTKSETYRHLAPEGGFGANELAKRGHEHFLKACVRCHAINQDGGRVGPDLNVPRNILSYRPEEQVREFIADPKQFRYSTMPAHPDLRETDLDELIAYLRLMGEHQHDPHAEKIGSGVEAP